MGGKEHRLLALAIGISFFGTPAEAQNWQPQSGYGPAANPAAPPPPPGSAMANPNAGMAVYPNGGQGGAVPGLTSPPAQAGQPANPVQGMLGMNMVPKFNGNFNGNFLPPALSGNRIPPGTVLTGILEQDLSSAKNKVGDVFSIRLEDGFAENGIQLIPQQSKVLGSILFAQSAKTKHGGMPGTIQIALQTLVFPDGRTCPISGFIEHNPLNDAPQPNNSHPGKTASQYAQHMGWSAMNFFTRRVGYNMAYPTYGKEFQMKQGEVLPIRLNQGLDLTKMTAPVNASPAAPNMAPTQQFGLSAGQMGSLPKTAPTFPSPSIMPNANGNMLAAPGYGAPSQTVPGLAIPPASPPLPNGSSGAGQPEPF